MKLVSHCYYCKDLTILTYIYFLYFEYTVSFYFFHLSLKTQGHISDFFIFDVCVLVEVAVKCFRLFFFIETFKAF